MATDLHYADKPTAGNRHYRETLRKFDEAAKQFANDNVDLVVELGDFIDAADSLETEKGYLTTITKRFSATRGQHHYVLGNHCVYALNKAEFLEIVGDEEISPEGAEIPPYIFAITDAMKKSNQVTVEIINLRSDGTTNSNAPYGNFIVNRVGCHVWYKKK